MVSPLIFEVISCILRLKVRSILRALIVEDKLEKNEKGCTFFRRISVDDFVYRSIGYYR